MGRALDMILTGRAVGAEEAERIGLVDRVVEPGQAFSAATALAEELARLPQTCLRADRRSAYEQWALAPREALENEHRVGVSALSSPELLEGLARFAAGAGRGRKPDRR
jgi:enoyl-CoA hydratase